MAQSLDNDSTEKSSQPAVLVVTVGTTDIKFGVEVKDGSDCLLSGKSFPVGQWETIRSAHHWLLEKNDWDSQSFVSPKQFVEYERVRKQFKKEPDGKPLLPSIGQKKLEPDDLEILFNLDQDHNPVLKLAYRKHNAENDSELKEAGSLLAIKSSEKRELKPELWLVKVMPVVEELIKSRKYCIELAVVLNTHRNPDKFRNVPKVVDEEPIAAGKMVCDWLATRLKLTNLGHYMPTSKQKNGLSNGLEKAFNESSKGLALYMNFLDEGMMSDGRGEDAFVNRQGMTRIDNLLFEISLLKPKNSQGGDENKWHFIYSPGGGIPRFKDQISAACHLYFDNVDVLMASQFFGEALKFEDADKYPAPDVSYRFREQAIQLLQHGDYAGAATIAQLVQQQIAIEISGKSNREKEAHYNWRWTQVLLDISHWLQGTLALEREEEIGGDLTHPAHPLHHLVGKHTPYALKVAFRIEAALQQNHIQEAIRYTSDLAEVLIYDYLSLVFSEKDKFGRADYRYFTGKNLLEYAQKEDLKAAAAMVMNVDFSAINDNKKLTFPLENKNKLAKSKALIKLDGEIWEPKTIRGAANSMQWQEIACYLAQEACSSSGLKKLKDALRTKPKGGSLNPVDYRNKITHQVLSAEQINEAITTYQAAGLWSDSVSKPEQTNVRTQQESQARFLSQDLVKNVFNPMLRLTTGDVNLLEQYKTLIEQTIQLIYLADIAWREETTVGSM